MRITVSSRSSRIAAASGSSPGLISLRVFPACIRRSEAMLTYHDEPIVVGQGDNVYPVGSVQKEK